MAIHHFRALYVLSIFLSFRLRRLHKLSLLEVIKLLTHYTKGTLSYKNIRSIDF